MGAALEIERVDKSCAGSHGRAAATLWFSRQDLAKE
jgi:hypothetical protein